jgi:SHAQKYF class myb-like DNA-binding protein
MSVKDQPCFVQERVNSNTYEGEYLDYDEFLRKEEICIPTQQFPVTSQQQEVENDISNIDVYNNKFQKRPEENFCDLFQKEKQNLSCDKQSHISSNLSESNSNFKFNTGRWTPQEHSKFIEAIIIYGNDWKRVQQHIKTRSPAQARSHAQKFFIRLKKRFQEEFHNESNIMDQQERILEWLKETSDTNVLNSLLSTEGKGCSQESDIIVSERKDKLCKLILSMCTSQNTRIKRNGSHAINCEKLLNYTDAFNTSEPSLMNLKKDLSPSCSFSGVNSKTKYHF